MEKKRNTILSLTEKEMRNLGYRAVDMIIKHMRELPEKKVTRQADRETLEKLLREPLPEKGMDANLVLDKIEKDVLTNIMHVDHPRFFAFIPSANNFGGVLADIIASGFNVFAGAWIEGAAAAQVELIAVDWLRQLCGFPEEAGGLFVSGGTVANLTALVTARYVKMNDRVRDAVVYYSDQTHSSLERALHILGFEQSQLCKIESDENYRLPIKLLKEKVSKDRASGKIPFCVIANAGTTNTGAVDPLPELAEFCRNENLWLHADGAYGAAGVLCEKGRTQLRGLELVDSLSIDPHKWLFQPYDIGCVILRDGSLLKKTFSMLPEYLKDVAGTEREINFFDYGIQISRSFRALKVWLSFKIFGVESFLQVVTKGFENAEFAEKIIRKLPDWEVVIPATLGIVTFRYTGQNLSHEEINEKNQKIVHDIMEDGYAMVVSTILKGKTVLRMCPINPRTTEEDILKTIKKLDTFAGRNQ